MRITFLASIVWLVGLCAPVSAQVPTTLSAVEFTCPDHAHDGNHELGFFLAGQATPVATIALGDPAPDANGVIVAPLPSGGVTVISPAQYELKVRAVFPGGSRSAWAAGGPNGDVVVPFERVGRPPVNLRPRP